MGLPTIRFHLRGLRRHAVDLTKHLLGISGPPRDPSTTTAAWHMPDPTHPSTLCVCPCGPDGAMEEHLPDCEWLARMCLNCAASGYCPVCGGDGTKDAEAPEVKA